MLYSHLSLFGEVMDLGLSETGTVWFHKKMKKTDSLSPTPMLALWDCLVSAFAQATPLMWPRG